MSTSPSTDNHFPVRSRRMRHVVFALIPTVVVLIVGLVLTEVILSALGFGNPPLYQSDPEVDYVLKPSQNLTRLRGARVFINSLGMRSDEITPARPDGIFRVVMLGDSVPFGGSYIGQDDLFCSVHLKDPEQCINTYFIPGDAHWNEAGHRIVAQEFMAAYAGTSETTAGVLNGTLNTRRDSISQRMP